MSYLPLWFLLLRKARLSGCSCQGQGCFWLGWGQGAMHCLILPCTALRYSDLNK